MRNILLVIHFTRPFLATLIFNSGYACGTHTHAHN